MYDEIQRILAESAIVHELQVIELTPYGSDAFRAKLRAEVTSDLTLQVWINHNDRRTRYAYHCSGMASRFYAGITRHITPSRGQTSPTTSTTN